MAIDPMHWKMAFPSLLTATERSSQSNQQIFFAARATELGAMTLAAAAGEMPHDVWGDAGPIVALVLFVAALVVGLSDVGDRAEKRWYSARAASESIKSTAWQYAARGEAFRTADAAATQRIGAEFRAILDALDDLDVAADVNTAGVVTPQMQALREAPQDVRARLYCEQRVQDQINWYATEAAKNKHRALQFRVLLVVLESVACLLGLFRVLGLFDVNWLGILAAAAASVAAWRQAKNYGQLSTAYAVTSHEANMVAGTIDASADDATWAQLVHDAEAAFSREHTLWLARRQGPTVQGL